MICRIAKVQDIDEILQLHFRYQVDSIKEEDKKDGFVTTAFTKEQLKELIEKEQGLFIALKNEKIIAYVISASWEFFSIWPMFAFMMQDLKNIEYQGKQLSLKNSYQYGPICIDKSVRGSGILEEIFEFSLEKMSHKFEFLVTFVNKINPRSYQAHKRKLKLEVVKEFEFNNNQYFEFVCNTKRQI